LLSQAGKDGCLDCSCGSRQLESHCSRCVFLLLAAAIVIPGSL